MKLTLLSVYNKVIDTSSTNGYSFELVHSEYELISIQHGLSVALKVLKGEKLLNKLKEIFNQDVEVEMFDANIR